ncbi:MAG: APC family permease [Deltaproteobacteria bacterium]|nr:APC family permease [Deltaproteobacteria bacterium]
MNSGVKTKNRILKKTINNLKAISLIIGSVLGSGLMILPGLVYKNVGAISFYSWLLMGIIIIPFLYVFIKLTLQFPSAGGLVNIINEIFGIDFYHTFSYLTLLSTIILVPVVAVIGANYVGYLFNLTSQQIVFIAAFLLIITTLLNIFDTNLVLKIQGISALLLLLLLFIIIITSSKIAFPQFAIKLSAVNLLSKETFASTAIGIWFVFWAFLGWENLSFTTEEFTNIKKDLPKATVISYCVMMFLYLGLSISVVGLLSQQSQIAAQVPLAEVITHTFGAKYGKIVAVVGVLIMLINLNAWVWGPSRLLYDCGRKKILPAVFSRLTKKQTPAVSLLTLLIMYLLILGYMLISKTYELDNLIKLVNANFMSLYLFSSICFIKHSVKIKDKAIGYIAMLLMASIICFCGLYILFPLSCLILGWLKKYIKNKK